MTSATSSPAASSQGDAQDNSPDSSPVISAREAAHYIGVSSSLLKKDRRERHFGIPFIKCGPRFVRYRVADLDAWMKENATSDTPPAPASEACNDK